MLSSHGSKHTRTAPTFFLPTLSAFRTSPYSAFVSASGAQRCIRRRLKATRTRSPSPLSSGGVFALRLTAANTRAPPPLSFFLPLCLPHLPLQRLRLCLWRSTLHPAAAEGNTNAVAVASLLRRSICSPRTAANTRPPPPLSFFLPLCLPHLPLQRLRLCLWRSTLHPAAAEGNTNAVAVASLLRRSICSPPHGSKHTRTARTLAAIAEASGDPYAINAVSCLRVTR